MQARSHSPAVSALAVTACLMAGGAISVAAAAGGGMVAWVGTPAFSLGCTASGAASAAIPLSCQTPKPSYRCFYGAKLPKDLSWRYIILKTLSAVDDSLPYGTGGFP